MARSKRTAAQETETTRATIYCRCSTSEQADSGLGLEVQERRCRAFCEARGWEVAGVYIDAGVSAKTLNRPQLQAALASLAPGTMLVVLKLDRLTRAVADLATLDKTIRDAGANWSSATEQYDTSSATGRLMRNLILELSQWEREIIGERTTAALAQKRERRERLGTTPLGYRTENGVVTTDASEQETVRRARELRRQGLTLREVADILTTEGRTTKRGGRWHAQTVSDLIQTRYLESIAA